MKNIALTGYMASGKTTVGSILSKRLGYKFLDTDYMIEEKCGKTINEIFEKHGEAYFRDIEKQVIEKCSAYESCIISCGGGVVLNKKNIENLKKSSLIFNLNPTEEIIKERLSSAAATRPLLNENDINGALERFRERIPYYNFCDFKIDVVHGESPDDLADEIIEIYRRNEQ